MANPLWRAQERTSALLGAASGPGERAGVVLASSRFSGEASAPTAVMPVPVLPVGVLLWAGCLLCAAGVFCSVDGGSAASSADTARVTPYSAPTTRIASLRGSVESKVSFTAVAFRSVETSPKLEVGRETSKAAASAAG